MTRSKMRPDGVGGRGRKSSDCALAMQAPRFAGNNVVVAPDHDGADRFTVMAIGGILLGCFRKVSRCCLNSASPPSVPS